MSHDKALFDLVRHPLKVRMLGVLRVLPLTPSMRRITLGGPDLDGFTSLAPEDHVKVFFPRPGEGRPIVPTLGPLGLVLPSLGPRPVGRDYTPRRYDAGRGELDIDFFLHGSGAAATWAASAAPGQILGVAGPRGSYVLKKTFPWHLFVVDETAFPEVARRVEEMPPTSSAHVVAIANGPHEEQPLQGAAAVDLRWVHRPNPNADVSRLVLEELRSMPLPSSQGFCWLAGEASEMRAIYTYLIRQRNVPVSHVHSSGHWKRGVVAHDHHQPIEIAGR